MDKLRELIGRIKDRRAAGSNEAEVISEFAKMMKGEKGDRGEKGEKGDSITGPQGERGEKGEKGDAIVGPQGPRGERGPVGEKGADATPVDHVAIIAQVQANLHTSLTARINQLFSGAENRIMTKVKQEMSKIVSHFQSGAGGGSNIAGTVIKVQPTAPSNPQLNDLWVDTSQ